MRMFKKFSREIATRAIRVGSHVDFRALRAGGVSAADIDLLERLYAMGADLEAPRHVLFFLHFRTKRGATASAKELKLRGLSAEVDKAPQSWLDANPGAEHPWTLVAESHSHALLPDFLRETVQACESLAADNGGVFDGWEAGLTVGEAGLV